MFKINPIIPSSTPLATGHMDTFSALLITTSRDVTQEEVDALGIPKYVGKLEPNYGITIDLSPSKVAGEINERGIKRVKAFLKKAGGHITMTDYPSANTVSLEEFCNFHNI